MTGDRPPIRPPDRPLTDGLVRLRPLELADVDEIYEACQDAEIARWTTVPQPYRREDAQAFVEATRSDWMEGRDPTFAVVAGDDGRLAGVIGLRGGSAGRWEVGYWAAPESRGRGVTTAAVRLITAWALRELGAQRVALLVYVGNVASARVAEKAGYRREGVLRRYADQRGVLRDTIVHSVIPEDLA